MGLTEKAKRFIGLILTRDSRNEFRKTCTDSDGFIRFVMDYQGKEYAVKEDNPMKTFWGGDELIYTRGKYFSVELIKGEDDEGMA